MHAYIGRSFQSEVRSMPFVQCQPAIAKGRIIGVLSSTLTLIYPHPLIFYDGGIAIATCNRLFAGYMQQDGRTLIAFARVQLT